jgi:hypothetical protein
MRTTPARTTRAAKFSEFSQLLKMEGQGINSFSSSAGLTGEKVRPVHNTNL